MTEKVDKNLKSALLGVFLGLRDKYVVQVIKRESGQSLIPRGKLKLVLSDGVVSVAAELQNSKPSYNFIKDKSLVRVELQYETFDKPLEITSLEIVQADYGYIFGNPIPFIEYLNRDDLKKLSSAASTQSNHLPIELKQVTLEPPKPMTQPKVEPVRRFERSKRPQLTVEDIDRLEETQVIVPKPSEQSKFQSLDNYNLISDLYEKLRGWKLLARVTWLETKMCTAKAGIKTGQKILVCNFFIVDQSGEIKCTLFDEAASKFKDVIKRYGVYEFSQGTLIEDTAQNSGGGFYKDSPKKTLNIRFQNYSKIVDRSECLQGRKLPLNFYKLKSYEELVDYDLSVEFDVAGIVKTILVNQQSISTKKKVNFIITDPFERRELEVNAFFEPQDAGKIEADRVIVLKNIKLGIRQNNLVFLRSCYNTQLLTEFSQDEQPIKKYREYVKNNSVQRADFESFSQAKFYRRSFKQLMDLLNMCPENQSVFSRVQCYFTGCYDNRRFTYAACYKCNKKVKMTNKYSSFCDKCGKIVDVRDQYLIQSNFADHTQKMRLSLIADHAKKLLNMDANKFEQMSHDEQLNKIRSLEFKEVVLLIRSTKNIQGISHSVCGIEAPQLESNMQLLRKFMEEMIKTEVN